MGRVTPTAPESTPAGLRGRNGQILAVALAGLATAPGVIARMTGIGLGDLLAPFVFGFAILGSAFLLAWAAETLQLDVSQGLALTVLALIAVLPEYAVDFTFAYKAGENPEKYAPLALANMTGGNRLLIGVGWSMVVLVAAWRIKSIAKKKGYTGELDTDVHLERPHAIEITFLALATAYSLTLPFKHTLTIFDSIVLITIFLAFVVAGLIGILIEQGIIRFLYGRPLETLLATWGLSLILQQAVRTAFGPTNREVGAPSWMSGTFSVGQINITYGRLWIIVFTMAVFVGLLGLLRFTRMGLEMRAVTQNRAMAASMGIRTARIDALTFGLGSGIAGIAGVALSQIDNVSPNLGQGYIIDSFLVVVFGVVGNLWGTLVAALTLGVANKFLEPFAGAVLAKIAILVFIILFIQKRPRGLFALKGRAVET